MTGSTVTSVGSATAGANVLATPGAIVVVGAAPVPTVVVDGAAEVEVVGAVVFGELLPVLLPHADRSMAESRIGAIKRRRTVGRIEQEGSSRQPGPCPGGSQPPNPERRIGHRSVTSPGSVIGTVQRRRRPG
jgi:hypothetical protein